MLNNMAFFVSTELQFFWKSPCNNRSVIQGKRDGNLHLVILHSVQNDKVENL
jgi:hypothetical protein